MIRVGITGGIGSGKSTVCKIFAALGVPVFHADIEAGKLYRQKDIIRTVTGKFGKDMLDSSGGINKKILSDIVFNDPVALAFLNSVIHPAVREVYQKWLQGHSNRSYTIYEAAILMESGYYKHNDLNIVVTAPEDLRIRRVVKRDQVTDEDVRNRIKNQWDDEQRISRTDFVITNDGNSPVIPQVLKIHQDIICKDA